ncbi:MAG: helix-turn-helix transcriptional regulator [Propionibacterium sp.]|nr:helix-turn-helix transcriptional regulator [Propionibacterium sp.]
MEDIPTQLRKGALELAVLALLAQEPRYGVEIVDELARRPGLETSAGTIYPLLTRLKNSGLVTTTWRESPVGPPRKYYTLSASGVWHFKTQRDAWLRLSTALITLFKEIQS